MGKDYEFDEVTMLSAFAVGNPGNRTFFLAVGNAGEWLRLWLEKEQLEYLSLAIQQYILTVEQRISHHAGSHEEPTPDEVVPSGLPAAELEIEEIAIGFEDGKALLEFSVVVSGSQDEEVNEVKCLATLEQVKRLGEQSMTVCLAGRPRCPVCGGPIDPAGHFCPKNN